MDEPSGEREHACETESLQGFFRSDGKLNVNRINQTLEVVTEKMEREAIGSETEQELQPLNSPPPSGATGPLPV